MLDENEVLITQLRKVIVTNGRRAAREGMIIGWWLRQFEVIPPRRRYHTFLPSPGVVCECEMCRWQRGEKLW